MSSIFTPLGSILLVFIVNISCYSQNITFDSITKHTIETRPLQNGLYEIKEYDRDSDIIYKGTLSSLDPPVRHGKFYFLNVAGFVEASGTYVNDVPHGIWVYYDEAFDTIRVVDYASVWDFMETEAQDYEIDINTLLDLKKRDKETMNPNGTFYFSDNMPEFQGSSALEDYKDYVEQQMHYPIYAVRMVEVETVIIQFIVDTEGKVRNPTFIEKASSDLNIEALRILYEAPDWTPGTQSNLPVNFSITRAFDFSISRLMEYDSTWDPDYPNSSPLFNNGMPSAEFAKYISRNLRYPESAARRNKSGRVTVGFTVQEDGSLADIEIVRSIDPALDAEAIRVVKSSPLWKPAKVRGKPAAFSFVFPINFVLTGAPPPPDYPEPIRQP